MPSMLDSVFFFYLGLELLILIKLVFQQCLETGCIGNTLATLTLSIVLADYRILNCK